MTKSELRRAFPKASRWWIELQIVFERGPIIEIGSRIPRDGFEAAVLHKLFPTLYPHTAKHKAAATDALRDATRKRRPRAYRDSEITAVMNDVRVENVNAVRVEHHRRRLTPAEYIELRVELSTCRHRADLRDVIRGWLKRP